MSIMGLLSGFLNVMFVVSKKSIWFCRSKLFTVDWQVLRKANYILKKQSKSHSQRPVCMASYYRIAYFIPDKIYTSWWPYMSLPPRECSFHSSSVDVSGIIVDYFVVLTVSCVLKCYAKVQLYRFSNTRSLCQNMLMNSDTNHNFVPLCSIF